MIYLNPAKGINLDWVEQDVIDIRLVAVVSTSNLDVIVTLARH